MDVAETGYFDNVPDDDKVRWLLSQWKKQAHAEMRAAIICLSV